MPDSQVERFSIGVLYRLSGLDELLLHVMFCGLAQYSIARKLRAVIKADCFGRPRSDTMSSKARITWALPSECASLSARHCLVKSSRIVSSELAATGRGDRARSRATTGRWNARRRNENSTEEFTLRFLRGRT